jgi:hypothetical protein
MENVPAGSVVAVNPPTVTVAPLTGAFDPTSRTVPWTPRMEAESGAGQAARQAMMSMAAAGLMRCLVIFMGSSLLVFQATG